MVDNVYAPVEEVVVSFMQRVVVKLLLVYNLDEMFYILFLF